jgi:phage tail-like protein
MRSSVNPNFRFVVDVEGITQGAFTECTLPVVDWDYDEIKEGGLNTHVHRLPGRRKFSSITLKNGVGTSALMNWFIDTMGETFKRRMITVKLLNAKDKSQDPIMTWDIADAYPIKWTGPQLNTGENSIAIQTLEMACGAVTMTRHR